MAVIRAGLQLSSEAVVASLRAANGPAADIAAFEAAVPSLSHAEARALAKKLAVNPFWDGDDARMREGYDRYQGGTKACIAHAIAYAPYADLHGMESKKPVYAQTQALAEGGLAAHRSCSRTT
ncbi:hypothetical protein CXG81DRAFT_20883 [Caulochytrium protostelioides]|uniref:methylisocitrate lyase n=1 Tax=Caulochytrium protostelioides TaxID=1555241 RepID=A0A4P9X1X5_9FUNG|nr:hypothetical protein CXG81DRAFT_20883 [Caulochytrium protostelioides]|eukprot:RKO98968.1 hypothetical protein CXG81DRAFT_20883 [Caulochytrium protostelioides]